jgi:hypothetical protein
MAIVPEAGVQKRPNRFVRIFEWKGAVVCYSDPPLPGYSNNSGSDPSSYTLGFGDEGIKKARTVIPVALDEHYDISFEGFDQALMDDFGRRVERYRSRFTETAAPADTREKQRESRLRQAIREMEIGGGPSS